MIPTRALVPFAVAALLAASTASAAPLAIGDIVVTDQFTSSVLRIDPVSGAQATISAGGHLVNPTGVAVDATGMVFVIDSGGVIVRVDPAAYDAGNPGTNQEVVAQGALLTTPQDGTFDADGTLLVAVQTGSKLVRVDPNAFDPLHVEANQTLVASGDLISAPKDVAVDPATGTAYVTCFNTHRVVRVEPNGAQSLVAAGGSLFQGPVGIAREADGHLIVRGAPNGILRIDPDAFDGGNLYANQSYVALAGLLSLVNDTAVEANGDLVSSDGFAEISHVVRVHPATYDAAHPEANQTELSPQGILTSPLAIAVFAPEPSAVLLAAVATAALAARRRSRSRFVA